MILLVGQDFFSGPVFDWQMYLVGRENADAKRIANVFHFWWVTMKECSRRDYFSFFNMAEPYFSQCWKQNGKQTAFAFEL